VHARGAGAHGYFESCGTIGDEPVSQYTRAKLFQEKGKVTPMFVRFSDFKRDDLILNLVMQLKQCNPEIQERMVHHLTQCDPDYGSRV
jgi:catalase